MLPNSRFLGAALLFAAFGSEALTLGRIRGAALIGQPLDMAVQVQMDAGDDRDVRCFEADVFHADTKQDPSLIRIALEETAQTQVVSVRIISSAIIDEPVVTLYLRTGCGQNTTRRYVLLADIASEIAEPVTPLITPAPTTPAPPPRKRSPQTPQEGPVTATATTPPAAMRIKAAPAPRLIVRPPVKAAVTPDNSTIANDKLKTVRPEGQPRLILDSLEVLADRVKLLETAAPAGSSAEARDMARMQSLEGDVKALLALAAKNEASLLDLQAKLQKAESERFPGTAFFGFIGILMAFLAGLALFWRRQPADQATPENWSRGSVSAMAGAQRSPEQERPPTPPSAPSVLKTAEISTPPNLPQSSSPALAIDVSHVEMSEWRFNKLKQSGTPKTASATDADPTSPNQSQPQAQREHDK